MQLRIYKKIIAAVQSISDCTNPTVQVGKTCIEFDGLNSPYMSRRSVYFSEATTTLPEGVIYAQSSRYTLLVMGNAEDSSDEAYPPFPYKGIVHEWAGGTVPGQVIEPILNLLSSQLYLPTPASLDTNFVRAYVLEPVVTGWCYEKPVYLLANEKNEPLKLPGKPKYLCGLPGTSENYYPPHEQGSLLVGWADIEKPENIPVWQEGMWFLNHIIRPHGEHPDKTMKRTEHIDCVVAVHFGGEPYLAVRIPSSNKEIEILARDHNPIFIPPAQDGWIAIHPFPTNGKAD